MGQMGAKRSTSWDYLLSAVSCGCRIRYCDIPVTYAVECLYRHAPCLTLRVWQEQSLVGASCRLLWQDARENGARRPCGARKGGDA